MGNRLLLLYLIGVTSSNILIRKALEETTFWKAIEKAKTIYPETRNYEKLEKLISDIDANSYFDPYYLIPFLDPSNNEINENKLKGYSTLIPSMYKDPLIPFYKEYFNHDTKEKIAVRSIRDDYTPMIVGSKPREKKIVDEEELLLCLKDELNKSKNNCIRINAMNKLYKLKNGGKIGQYVKSDEVLKNLQATIASDCRGQMCIRLIKQYHDKTII